MSSVGLGRARWFALLVLLAVVVACRSDSAATPTSPRAMPAATVTPEVAATAVSELAERAATAAPADTAIPEPTAAPADTAIPKPTAEPADTAIPEPTAEPADTAIPEPTDIEGDTAIPEPTDIEGDTATADATAKPTITTEPTSAPTAEQPSAAAVKSINTAFILDASGSMLADLQGRTRLAVAQDAVARLSAALPSSINASLWVYGHRVHQSNKEESCKDIEEVIPMGPVDPDEFDRVAHGLGAKGWTPITDSLIRAAQSLPVGPDQRNTIILVSDGEETCGGDPCALAAELAASAARVTVHAIGLAVDDVTRAQLKCIAEVSGGLYEDADSSEGLESALEQAVESAAEDTFYVVEGLSRPEVVVVSPDGLNVYAAGSASGTLLTFSRDPLTGKLVFLGLFRDGEEGVGLRAPKDIAISPDGKHVYVTASNTAGDGGIGSVVMFSRADSDGRLSLIGSVDAFVDAEAVDGASGVAVSPDGQNVYVTGKDGSRKDDAVAVFQRNVSSGELTRVQLIRTGVDGVGGLTEATDVIVSPDNRNVYVSGTWKEMAVFSRAAEDGRLTFLQSLAQGVDVNKGLLGGQNMRIDTGGRHLYLCARRDGTITLFERDEKSGRLTFSDQLAGHAGERPDQSGLFDLYGAHGLALSPDGRHVYVSGDINNFLVVLERDQDTGRMSFVEHFQDDEAGIDGLEGSHSVAISPDGLSVYVAGFGDNALAVFGRDADTGRLSFVEVIRSPRD